MAPYADKAIKRRALPLDQMVRWLPLDDAYYLLAEVMTSTRALPLVVMQETLLQVEMHASSEVYGSTCGVLCGAPYRDPKSEAAYLLVEGIERATRVERLGDPEASLAVDLSRAVDAAEHAGRMVLGWYRFDVALSPRIPLADVGVHRSLFPEPWQVALLRDGADGEGSGAFVRVEPTEGRAFPIPFFELVPHRRGRGAAKHTSVQWRNYSAESEVVPLGIDAYRNAGQPSTQRPKSRGAPATESRPGIFARLGTRLSPSRQERPIIPHKPAERVAPAEAPPIERAAPAEAPQIERAARGEARPIEQPLPPAEPRTPPPQAVPQPAVPPPATSPRAIPQPAIPRAAAPEESVEIPASAEVPRERELPERLDVPRAPSNGKRDGAVDLPRSDAVAWSAAIPEAADVGDGSTTSESLEIANAPELPEARPVAGDQPSWVRTAQNEPPPQPRSELDAIFTDWRPDAAGRAGSDIPGVPQRWPLHGSGVKWLVAAALLLAAGYVGVQRLRAAQAERESVAAAAQPTRTEEIATGQLADARAARVSADRPASGAFAPAERAEVRSALARIGDSRATLVAHLDTLATAMSGDASDSSQSALCERAGALYRSSVDDMARIDVARRKITSLVGPMRMAGIDSLTKIAGDLRSQLRERCPQ